MVYIDRPVDAPSLGVEMTLSYVLLGLVVAVSIFLGGAKLAAVPAMRERAAHAGFSVQEYRGIGTLEILAAVGLLVGLAIPAIGVLAACGLLLLLGGAFAVHLRLGDGVPGVAPSIVVALLVTAYLLTILL
jgi:hypothetical protein